MPVRAVIFDAYGTLFDVYSISVIAEQLFPGKGAALTTLWRDKQIQYTQLRTLCSTYKPLWEVTQEALVYACKFLNLPLGCDAQNALMGQYAALSPFPENKGVLEKLRASGLKVAILSNGNTEMLSAVVRAAGMQDLIDHQLSVDAVRKFKTAPEAYQLGPDALGLSAKNILFVSSNGWDICGASWFGYTTFWVNRANAPLEELGVKPDATGADMTALLRYLSMDTER